MFLCSEDFYLMTLPHFDPLGKEVLELSSQEIFTQLSLESTEICVWIIAILWKKYFIL